MDKIGIIGGGFTGTMTAVQLINKLSSPCEIVLIGEKGSINTGTAYNPYSGNHLLNVVAGSMSAFPNKPGHFLDWVMARPGFKLSDKALIANSFLPRQLYGEYLKEIWKTALGAAASKKVRITIMEAVVTDLEINENGILLRLTNTDELQVSQCVVATGNQLPGNPTIKNRAFFQNKNYHQNPWKSASVKGTSNKLPVLLVGNGLTMVDTVLGLLEERFHEKIISISPNGFNILPHRNHGMVYTKLIDELPKATSLLELVSLTNKHIKSLRSHGISAEAAIDSLRPHTQRIWRKLSENERKLFMSRLRHLWGVARHRLPLLVYDKIQKLRLEGKLEIISGKIFDFNETDDHITVEYFDKKEKLVKQTIVSRIINCTGPQTDILKLEDGFLKKGLLKGILVQDSLKLGIKTNPETFEIMDANGKAHSNLYTLGPNLKGELWESTAVRELREQAERLAGILAERVCNPLEMEQN